MPVSISERATRILINPDNVRHHCIVIKAIMISLLYKLGRIANFISFSYAFRHIYFISDNGQQDKINWWPSFLVNYYNFSKKCYSRTSVFESGHCIQLFIKTNVKMTITLTMGRPYYFRHCYFLLFNDYFISLDILNLNFVNIVDLCAFHDS